MSFVDSLKKSVKQKKYSISDITVVMCVRIAEENAWVLDRLSFFSQWFLTQPHITVVDYGSEKQFQDEISHVCKNKGYKYYFVESDGVFSLSKARNKGFESCNTDLIFFTDPDCIFERDIFDKLLKVANSLDFSFNSFSRLTMPVYHISEQYSQDFDAETDCEQKERKLIQWASHGVYSDYGKVFEYISPYSNVFLCHRNYYDLVGGYSDKFEGHGSEDFEFILRANLLQGNMPIPDKPTKDIYKPGIPSSAREKYEGFRRLAEVEAFSAEMHGIRSFHLWHPRAASKGWYENNDMKRKVFNQVVSKYQNRKINLLKEDYLHREFHALCIVADESHLGYFLPLRVMGYSFDILSEKNQIVDVLNKIDQGLYKQVFIYNSYVETVFQGVVDRVDSSNANVTVIERGALPNSLYYAKDMSYQDPDFTDLTLEKLREFTSEGSNLLVDSERVGVLIKELKSGSLTLEKNADYQKSVNKLKLFLQGSENKLKIFIPLQLAYDTAVTMFNNGYPKYESFLKSISDAVEKYPDVLFIIKPHPLLKEADSPDILKTKANNLYVSNEQENVHALIELSDTVIVYNSGVGLLSIFHEKPVFHMGNAYFNVNQHFAKRVDTVAEVVQRLKLDKSKQYSNSDVALFVSWLINYKYSFFDAVDEYRELEHRNSHVYQNIQVALLNYAGRSQAFGSLNADYRYSSNSYAAAKLSLNSKDDHRAYIKNVRNELSLAQRVGVYSFSIITYLSLSSHNKAMLLENPKQFFRTAKHPFSVWSGNKLGLR